MQSAHLHPLPPPLRSRPVFLLPPTVTLTVRSPFRPAGRASCCTPFRRGRSPFSLFSIPEVSFVALVVFLLFFLARPLCLPLRPRSPPRPTYRHCLSSFLRPISSTPVLLSSVLLRWPGKPCFFARSSAAQLSFSFFVFSASPFYPSSFALQASPKKRAMTPLPAAPVAKAVKLHDVNRSNAFTELELTVVLRTYSNSGELVHEHFHDRVTQILWKSEPKSFEYTHRNVPRLLYRYPFLSFPPRSAPSAPPFTQAWNEFLQRESLNDASLLANFQLLPRVAPGPSFQKGLYCGGGLPGALQGLTLLENYFLFRLEAPALATTTTKALPFVLLLLSFL